MKKIIAIVLAIALAASIGGVALAGDSQPASKATAAVDDIHVIQADSLAETTILEQVIKIPGNNKDLFVDVSLETGLYTDTVVRSKNMEKETTSADARIEVMVQASPVQGYDADGNPILGDAIQALPADWVTFDYRMQALSATLQGAITNIICDLEYDDLGNITGVNCYVDEESLEPEEIGLLLDTMAAHSFNYILPDLPVDTYLVEVKARVSSSADEAFLDADGNQILDENGDPVMKSVSNATIGLGSVTIEAVRMVKDTAVEMTD